ncbi:HpcH/HpaI aldolase/citrate lyase family protein [Nocardia higoensis]|uniref:HpcH/HpaI aldolase/citrate lyase family protein n=1 Tax=Nocardia higoensis TaxID=228599 RepID=UPI0003100E71|nr:CoA ester lyase [Nocardia higoensis]
MSRPLTYLYVPGDKPERFGKALTSGADAIVLDLEDAVAAGRKAEARAAVATWVADTDPGRVEVWVRVNPGSLQDEDIQAVAHPRLTGIWLPKVGSAEEVERAHTLLANSACPDAAISAMIETAAGIFAAPAIARAPRVRFLQIGEVDLAADLGIDPESDATTLLFARSQIVAASVAAGIDPPPAAVSRDFRDLDAFTADTRALANHGFVGRACIHPAQLEPVRSVFTPVPEVVTEARAVLAALEVAESGVAVDVNGFLIDEAVARQARRVVERAETVATRR